MCTLGVTFGVCECTLGVVSAGWVSVSARWVSVSACWVSVSAGWVSVSVCTLGVCECTLGICECRLGVCECTMCVSECRLGLCECRLGPYPSHTPNMTFDLQRCCTFVVVVATFFTSCTLPCPPPLPQVKLLLIRVTPGVVCGVVFVIACVLVYLLQHDVFQWAEYL